MCLYLRHKDPAQHEYIHFRAVAPLVEGDEEAVGEETLEEEEG